MVTLVPLKMVSIIAIDSLQQRIIGDIKACGCRGYTVDEVEGEGLNNKHFTDWEGRNVKIDTLVTEEIAMKIMEMLSEKYFDRYSIIAYVSTVEVLRKEKFS
ncbi:MAG: P-II family nitrogen regulator [Bacteroidota bacterium]|jgi:nitrogen regulatory protein P-II 2